MHASSLKDYESIAHLIEMTPVIIFEWTQDVNLPTRFVSGNIRLYGYEPVDFYQGDMKDYWKFVHQDDRELVKNNLYKARSSGVSELRHQYRVLCRNGDVRWVEEIALFEKNEDKKSTYEKGILYDITKLKNMEMRIADSEIKYRTLFEKAPAIMLTLNSDLNITDVNRICCRLLGKRKTDLLGISIKELFGIDQFERIYTSEKFIANETEITLTDSAGNPAILALLINGFFQENKNIGYQLIGQNITLKKQYEDKIHFLSYHDKLTGLYNRAYLDDYLEKIELDNTTFSVIIGDINGLKDINDTYGHKAGDGLIIAVSQILEKNCRSSDLLARLGGDEFIIILKNEKLSVAELLVKRIKMDCQAYIDMPICPEIALGVAFRNSLEPVSNALKAADQAMYMDKKIASETSRSHY